MYMPNHDGSSCCSIDCTLVWFRELLDHEQKAWNALSEEIRQLLVLAQSKRGESGSH